MLPDWIFIWMLNLKFMGKIGSAVSGLYGIHCCSSEQLLLSWMCGGFPSDQPGRSAWTYFRYQRRTYHLKYRHEECVLFSHQCSVIGLQDLEGRRSLLQLWTEPTIMMSSVVCAKASSVILKWFFCVSLQHLRLPGFDIPGTFSTKTWSPHTSILKHGVEERVGFFCHREVKHSLHLYFSWQVTYGA